MLRAQQPCVGDEERDHEVQDAAHPGRRRRVPGSDHGALVDQCQQEPDDQRDPDRPAKIAPLGAERHGVPDGRAATSRRL